METPDEIVIDANYPNWVRSMAGTLLLSTIPVLMFSSFTFIVCYLFVAGWLGTATVYLATQRSYGLSNCCKHFIRLLIG